MEAGLLATQTLTFLFTDIEGSTAMLRRLGTTYAEVLAGHHQVIRACLAAHDGREIDTQGDAFFAVFTSPAACMAAAIRMQQALDSYAWPAGETLRVRMGMHSGEASETSVGLIGIDVHRGAGIAAVAHGGQVLLSATTAALVRDSMPTGASLRDLGLHRLKDLGRAEQIFQLEADGLPAAFRPLRSLDNPTLLNNLPAQVSSFIGRHAELSEVRRLVTTCRLVTLTGPVRYRLLETIRQYSARKLDGLGPAAARNTRIAHRNHYLAVAEAAGPQLVQRDQAEWMDRLNVELDNLRAAIAFSLQQHEPAPGLRTAAALRVFWKARGP